MKEEHIQFLKENPWELGDDVESFNESVNDILAKHIWPHMNADGRYFGPIDNFEIVGHAISELKKPCITDYIKAKEKEDDELEYANKEFEGEGR